MPDALHPSEIGLEVKVTDRCDQGCFHCMNDDRPTAGRDLDVEMFTRRLEEWAASRRGPALKEVRMTGGEPLLVPDSVLRIAEICARLGVPTGVNTNGIRLDESLARSLDRAGVETVKISLDSRDPETQRRMRGPGASLERTVEGIRIAVARGFRVILRTTLCRLNLDELRGTYRLARDLGVHRLQVKPLVASGRALRGEEFAEPSEIGRVLTELAGVVSGPVALPQVLCWPGGASAGLPSKACGSCRKIYVLPTGEVTICNFLADATPIGDLEEQRLADVLALRDPPLWRSPDRETLLAGCPQIRHFARH